MVVILMTSLFFLIKKPPEGEGICPALRSETLHQESKRRGRDSNPRTLAGCTLSKRVH